MCGIIGFTGKNKEKGGQAVQIAVEGLRSLAYRGYDSAGIAYFNMEKDIRVVKAKGKIACLEEKLSLLSEGERASLCAIGHTRWATHGAPDDKNSHPHGTDRVQIVHNGIIENYLELRAELTAGGYAFRSETDTETAALLIDACLTETGGDPLAALRMAKKRLCGSYALAVLFADRPGVIYALRRDNPLIVGMSGEGTLLASDITALLSHTRQYYTPTEHQIAVLTPDGVCFYDSDVVGGEEIGAVEAPPLQTASWDVRTAEKQGYAHFMQKEIREEPEAIRRTLSSRIRDGLPYFGEELTGEDALFSARRIFVVACGTAMHAGFYGKHLFEGLVRIPVAVEIASEFRYCNPLVEAGDLVILISQSGETADTLAALRLAKERGAYTLGIVNTVGSTIAREADATLYTRAGVEIAVASTKAYTVQCALLGLLAVRAAMTRGKLTEEEARRAVLSLTEELPQVLESLFAREEEFATVSKALAKRNDLFFIGRSVDYFAAMEGSLKLKEISYIHSEAYAAGELKHGTISLIEEDTPVIAIATVDALREKMVSNIKEVVARGARVYTVTREGWQEFGKEGVSHRVLPLPALPAGVGGDLIAPLAVATVLQMLAYHTAVARGCDVDQPRNLAKSVTVE